jgi:hypothetical protein
LGKFSINTSALTNLSPLVTPHLQPASQEMFISEETYDEGVPNFMSEKVNNFHLPSI